MKRLCLIVFAAATAVGCGSHEAQPSNGGDETQPSNGGDKDVQLPPAVTAQMEALIAEKAARTPAQRKIASSLLYAKSGRFDAQLAANELRGRPIKSLSQVDATGRVLVDIQGDMSAVGGKIGKLGGSAVEVRSSGARAWMPLDKMEQLASESAVKAIHPAYLASTRPVGKPSAGLKALAGSRADRIAAVQAAQAAWAERQTSGAAPQTFVGATNAGSVVSEGDKAESADRARQFYGTDGTGVKIGVLSDSDDLKELAIATGDLPPNTTTVPGQDGRPGTGEGTAMLEIVHDVAPGADLFFATAFNGPLSFAANIRALRFQYHCDIIIDDAIYFFESPYQDDIIAQAVDDVTADGALYFSSAGNEGNADDGTSGTWEGDFEPSGSLATLPSGYTVHSFGDGVVGNRIEATGGPLILHWSDPGTLANPTSSNDYDLFVLDNDLRTVVLASTDIQDGTGLPFEFLGFVIPAGFRVVIAAHPNAEVRAIHTMIVGGEYANSTRGAIFGHNSATDAFAVGAVDAAEASGGEFIPGLTTPIELFSSDGPRRIFFDRVNQPINSANPGLTFASHGGISRAKPDLSAADGVTTTLPAGSGLNPFFGTSAAAPHAGAIAALIKSAIPNITPTNVRSALQSGAIDVDELGTDRNAGRGVVSAFNALNRAGALPAVSLALGAVTVTPIGSTVLSPGGSAQVSIQITNGGGASATAVSSTLTSGSPNALIQQGSSAYPTIPSGGSASSTTAFTFSVAAATPCGATLPFTLTASFSGNAGSHPSPAVFQLSVPVGRQASTTMHFAYTGAPVAIPDANAVGVDVPLTVSGFSGQIVKAVFNIDGTACSTAAGSTTVGLDHTFVNDLSATLSSPSGRTIMLFNRAGGAGHNFCQTVFDDNAATSIQTAFPSVAPFTGTFQPAQPLAGFAGQAGNGTWILHVTDNAFFDSGSVRAFSLDLTGFSCTQ